MNAAATATALTLVWFLPGSARAQETDTSCVSCHLDAEDPDLSAPVEEWRHSVHATAEVSCDACHGGDPFEEDEELSMDEEEAGFMGAPGWADVPEFCGSCHEEILDAYRQSVMASLIGVGVRVAVCTTCHMSDGHAISHAVPREILTEERCGECHDPARGIVLRDLLEDLGARIGSARERLDEIREMMDVSALDQELGEIRWRAVVAAHTYDRHKITEVSRVARERLEGLSVTTRARAEQAAFRQRVGFGVVGFLLAACLGVIGLQRSLRRRDVE